jgi:NitT/TauT family transport system ATP-binding protein
MFGLELNGDSKEENLRRARIYLKSVELSDFEKSYPHELSGGMKQRVAIARTLVNKTKVLLMDEPFSALDMQNRHKLQEELIRIWKKTKKTIIFVTHDVDESVFLADEVVIMGKHPGRIKKIFKINLDHHRHRENREFLDIQSQIIDSLDEIEDL